MQIESDDMRGAFNQTIKFALPMKQVLRHNKTLLFLTMRGRFTGNPDAAAAWNSLNAAMKFCARLNLDLTEFCYESIKV